MSVNEVDTTIEAGEASAEQIKQGVREVYAARVSGEFAGAARRLYRHGRI